MEGGAGYGGYWGIWVLSVVGLGVEEVELHFLPLEIDTQREIGFGFTFMKLGEVDTLLWMCISCSHKERGKIFVGVESVACWSRCI